MIDTPSVSAADLAALEAAGLGALGARMLQMQQRLEQAHRDIDWRDTKIDKLSFEVAQLKRLKFGKTSEQLGADQRALFDESVDADIAAAEAELEQLQAAGKPREPGQRPKRQPLPAHLPRTEHRHEPENTQCACGCALQRVGEDISERLDSWPTHGASSSSCTWPTRAPSLQARSTSSGSSTA